MTNFKTVFSQDYVAYDYTVHSVKNYERTVYFVLKNFQFDVILAENFNIAP